MKNAKVAAAAAIIAIGGAIGLQSVQVQARMFTNMNLDNMPVTENADTAKCMWYDQGVFGGASSKVLGNTDCE